MPAYWEYKLADQRASLAPQVGACAARLAAAGCSHYDGTTGACTRACLAALAGGHHHVAGVEGVDVVGRERGALLATRHRALVWRLQDRRRLQDRAHHVPLLHPVLHKVQASQFSI